MTLRHWVAPTQAIVTRARTKIPAMMRLNVRETKAACKIETFQLSLNVNSRRCIACTRFIFKVFFEREAYYNTQQEIIFIGFARTQNCFQKKSRFFRLLFLWNVGIGKTKGNYSLHDYDNYCTDRNFFPYRKLLYRGLLLSSSFNELRFSLV